MATHAEGNPQAGNVYEALARIQKKGTPRRFDLVGRRFGRLVVLAFAGKRGASALWSCRCDCGAVKSIRAGCLLRGDTTSCGCYCVERVKAANTKHGRRGSATHNTWRQMLSRAHTGSATCARNYRDRGIRVCERWLRFENFLVDMGERPKGLSLDRIDNAKGYEPGNCRWATALQQQRNKRSNRIIEAFGRAQPVSAWAAELGITSSALRNRIKRWPLARALSAKKQEVA